MLILTSGFSIGKQIDDILGQLVQVIPRIAVAILIVLVGFAMGTGLRQAIVRLFSRNNADKTVVSFVASFTNVCLKLIVVIMAIAYLGININGILAAVGAAGLAIGLALKDSLSNIACGLLILMNKPFRANDYIKVDGYEGNVKKIEIMFTTLLTAENNNVVIPNSKMLSSSIINFTMEEQRRLDLKFMISYKEDIHRVKEILSAAAYVNPLVTDKEKIVAAAAGNLSTGVMVVLQVQCHYKDYSALNYQLQESIKLEFDRQNIQRA